jgi:anti-sigma regulatory factor (Ser/Thr protein kinase)
VRDLSLHILDVMENSIRAGATAISLTVAEDPEQDRLTIIVEDNGPGLSVPPDVATDPFYTTKNGKRTGLGLSLLRATAEQAGGKLTLRRSELGGLAVEAAMQLSHVDRSPLGDLAATSPPWCAPTRGSSSGSAAAWASGSASCGSPTYRMSCRSGSAVGLEWLGACPRESRPASRPSRPRPETWDKGKGNTSAI